MVSYLTIIKREIQSFNFHLRFGMVSYLTIIKQWHTIFVVD